MDSRAGKVALACFIGGFLGTVVAMEIGRFFWWVGLIIGGFAGYISYEFRAVVSAIPKAWKAVTSFRLPAREAVIEVAAFFGFMTVVMGTVFLPLFLAYFIKSSSPLPGLFLLLCLLWGFGWAGLMDRFVQSEYVRRVFSPVVDVRVFKGSTKDMREPKVFWSLIVLCNPVTAYIVFPLIGFVWVVSRLPVLLLTLMRFFWQLFKLVHSDIRLLCGVDAAIGVVFGYFFGNPIIGGAVGVALGVLNYEIVSKRWLKLVPIRS